jgi:hypothetical protein
MGLKSALVRLFFLPEDKFGDWCSSVIERAITDRFYDSHEDWVWDKTGLCMSWMKKLFDKGKSPDEAARIIERAYNFYTR